MGVHYVHFEKKYYIDFKDKLLKLIIDLELSKLIKNNKTNKFKITFDDWQIKMKHLIW